MTPDERPTAKPIHLQQEMIKHLLNIIQNVLTGTSPPPPILLIFTLQMSFIKLLRMYVYCLESKIHNSHRVVTFRLDATGIGLRMF